jgi:plastocyanin
MGFKLDRSAVPGRSLLGAKLLAVLLALVLVSTSGCGNVKQTLARVKHKVASLVHHKGGDKKKVAAGAESEGKTATMPSETVPARPEPEAPYAAAPSPRTTVRATTSSHKKAATSHVASRSTRTKHTTSTRRTVAARSTTSRSHKYAVASSRSKSSGTRSGAGAVHVRLVQGGCVEFEPQWATIRVGQSVVWHSRLKRSVTIHVPHGAFAHTAYTVRAGGTASSGPARSTGSYAMWTKPGACRGTPVGALGAGPGVKIERRARSAAMAAR